MFDVFDSSSNDDSTTTYILGGEEHQVVVGDDAPEEMRGSVSAMFFDDKTGDLVKVPAQIHVGTGGLYVFLPGHRVMVLSPKQADGFVDAYEALILSVLMSLGETVLKRMGSVSNQLLLRAESLSNFLGVDEDE